MRAGDGAGVVGGDGAVVDHEPPRAFVLRVERARLGHHHRELADGALVELRQDVRHEVAVARDDQRLVVVAQVDAERDEHGPQQVPVVQPRDGGAAHLERVDGRGGMPLCARRGSTGARRSPARGKGKGTGGEGGGGSARREKMRVSGRDGGRIGQCGVQSRAFRASRDVPRRSQSPSWCPRPGRPCPSGLWWADATHPRSAAPRASCTPRDGAHRGSAFAERDAPETGSTGSSERGTVRPRNAREASNSCANQPTTRRVR